MTYEPPPPPPPPPSSPAGPPSPSLAGPPPILAAPKPKPTAAPSPLAWRSSSELVMPSEQYTPPPPSADLSDAALTAPPVAAPFAHPTGPLSASPEPFGPPGQGGASPAAQVPGSGPPAASPGPSPTGWTPASNAGPTPTGPAPQGGSSVTARLAEGLLVGVASGVVAGVAWWAVVAFTQRQFVYLSVILGAMVGQGVLIGARRGGILCGALAAIITLTALAVAQYFIERSLAISKFQVEIPLWSGFSFAKTVVHESINETPLSGVFALIAAGTAAASAGLSHARPKF